MGAFLANLMCKNLTYKVGNQKHILLKPEVLRGNKSKKASAKTFGYVCFNKAFTEQFVTELDKVHDLNLQIERSLPMIYPPAPWKNYFFGGYYLKQTKIAKV